MLWPVVCLMLIAAWMLAGIAVELRKRLAGRVARWLLPDEQAWTYRVACGICRLSVMIAPTHRVDGSTPHPGSPRPVLARQRLRWSGPAAALGELDENLRLGQRHAHPISLALPILWRALVLRRRNARERGRFLLAWTRSLAPSAGQTRRASASPEASSFDLAIDAVTATFPAAKALVDLLSAQGIRAELIGFGTVPRQGALMEADGRHWVFHMAHDTRRLQRTFDTFGSSGAVLGRMPLWRGYRMPYGWQSQGRDALVDDRRLLAIPVQEGPFATWVGVDLQD